MKKLRSTFAIAASTILLCATSITAYSQAPKGAALVAAKPQAPQGRHIKAVIELPLLYRLLSNSDIEQILEKYELNKYGFAEVSVTGSWSTRSLLSTYTDPDKPPLDKLRDLGILAKLKNLGVILKTFTTLADAAV